MGVVGGAWVGWCRRYRTEEGRITGNYKVPMSVAVVTVLTVMSGVSVVLVPVADVVNGIHSFNGKLAVESVKYGVVQCTVVTGNKSVKNAASPTGDGTGDLETIAVCDHSKGVNGYPDGSDVAGQFGVSDDAQVGIGQHMIPLSGDGSKDSVAGKDVVGKSAVNFNLGKSIFAIDLLVLGLVRVIGIKIHNNVADADTHGNLQSNSPESVKVVGKVIGNALIVETQDVILVASELYLIECVRHGLQGKIDGGILNNVLKQRSVNQSKENGGTGLTLEQSSDICVDAITGGGLKHPCQIAQGGEHKGKIAREQVKDTGPQIAENDLVVTNVSQHKDGQLASVSTSDGNTLIKPNLLKVIVKDLVKDVNLIARILNDVRSGNCGVLSKDTIKKVSDSSNVNLNGQKNGPSSQAEGVLTDKQDYVVNVRG